MAELTVPQVDFSALGQIPGIIKQNRADQLRQQTLASLGQGTDVDASALLKSGDLSLAQLGVAMRNRSSDDIWRQQEAARAQQNADRSFGLQSRAADRADEGPVEQAGYRAQVAQKYGIDPNTPEGRSFITTGKLPDTSGGISETASQRAAAARSYGIDPATPQGKSYILTGKLPEEDKSFQTTIEQRKQAAVANGLDPSSPGFQSFVLTGKMPREDAQPLTATDKKAVLEADEKVQAGRTTIDNLNKAKVLSKQALSGPYAGKLGYAASFLGDGSDTGKAGIATEDLHNLVTSNALQQLKTIFGGNPTEGERGILLDIQGSVNKPDAVRQKIFDRAIEAANKRLVFEQQRADQLRGGQFYKPQAAPPQAAATQTAPQQANVTSSGVKWSVE